MKNKNIFFLAGILFVVALGVGVVSCSRKGTPTEMKEGKEILYYTCPMHPQVHQDRPGDCPICNMKLVPIFKSDGSDKSDASDKSDGIKISSDRQQLIGIKTVVAGKKEAVKEIRTVGRVAFDPALAVAQREYLEILKNVPSLKESARSHLRLKGMSEEEIRQLEHPSSNLYLPRSGEAVWVYATLYQGEFEVVTPGTEAEISLPSGTEKKFVGVVRAVDPVVNSMTRSARARIELPAAGGVLRPDTYVNVFLKSDLGEVLTIPKSAVINTGVRQVAFVVHGGEHFQSRDLKLGPEVGDEVVVREGVQAGETVVSSAAFLVDSESRLKAAVASAPACPEGQSWDSGMSMCMPTTGEGHD